MESAELARRKALQTTVAALCIEVGFISADKDAIETLSEILQSCKAKLVVILNDAHHNNLLLVQISLS